MSSAYRTTLMMVVALVLVGCSDNKPPPRTGPPRPSGTLLGGGSGYRAKFQSIHAHVGIESQRACQSRVDDGGNAINGQ